MSPSTSIDKAIIDLKVCNTLAHVTYYVDLGDSADAKACIDTVLRVLDELVRALIKHAPNAQRSLIRRLEQAYTNGRHDRLVVNTTREENGAVESNERPAQSDDSAQSAVAVAINAVASLSTQPSGADGEQHDNNDSDQPQQQGSSDEPMDGKLSIRLLSRISTFLYSRQHRRSYRGERGA